ncbi:MAG: hypothetical protein DWP92_08390 [Armatimonadetes bacterium]|nr:MAG: hypothetical protein DWP92_08390 [Armatimonadota bacterium]
MNGGIRLGSVGGIEVVADASASVLALLFAAAVMVDLLTRDLVSSNERALALGLFAGVAIVGSIFAHEAAHAIVAKLKGQRVLSIRMLIFGGYSVIEGEPEPMTEFQVATAGPATSILLGFLFWILQMADLGSGFTATMRALALANLAIGLFNLFPGFPLDGGRVLRGLVAERTGNRVVATRLVARVGRYTGWAILIAGCGLVVLQEPFGLFWIIVGWFLAVTAVQTGRREELAVAYSGRTARSVMRPVDKAVPGSMPVGSMIETYLMGKDMHAEPVEIDGRVVGVIGHDELDATAPARRVSTRVERLMTRIGPDDVVEADRPLQTIVMDRHDAGRPLVVVEDDTVIGIIDPSSLTSDVRLPTSDFG